MNIDADAPSRSFINDVTQVSIFPPPSLRLSRYCVKRLKNCCHKKCWPLPAPLKSVTSFMEDPLVSYWCQNKERRMIICWKCTMRGIQTKCPKYRMTAKKEWERRSMAKDLQWLALNCIACCRSRMNQGCHLVF